MEIQESPGEWTPFGVEWGPNNPTTSSYLLLSLQEGLQAMSTGGLILIKDLEKLTNAAQEWIRECAPGGRSPADSFDLIWQTRDVDLGKRFHKAVAAIRKYELG